MSLTSKYNNHLRKAIPLREHFLTDAHRGCVGYIYIGSAADGGYGELTN